MDGTPLPPTWHDGNVAAVAPARSPVVTELPSGGPLPSVEVVAYEDRPSQLRAVKVLVASLQRHSPTIHVSLVVPEADEPFRSWVRDQSNVDIVALDLGPRGGWDVKATVLLQMLERGHQAVAWIDSDVVVGRDALPSLSQCPGALLATEEVWYSRPMPRGSTRTTLWGLQPGGRRRPTINTAVVRVEPAHRRLLTAWQELLATSDYAKAQAQPIAARAAHVWGDQDVLDALLGSKAFDDVRVQLLRRGTEIAQCLDAAGFSPGERLRVRLLHRVPVFVHALGAKPWNRTRSDWDGRTAALSPYAAIAAGYSAVVGEDMSWTEPTTRQARVLIRLTRGDPVLRQFVPAVRQAVVWRARRQLGAVRRRVAR